MERIGANMRIAFASSDGRTIDAHFAQAESFYLWEVGPDHAESLSTISPPQDTEEREDRILARAECLEGCVVVFCAQIGGPAAAKLVSRHIQPLKAAAETPIADAIGRFQAALRDRPPPWLRKVMAHAPHV